MFSNSYLFCFSYWKKRTCRFKNSERISRRWGRRILNLDQELPSWRTRPKWMRMRMAAGGRTRGTRGRSRDRRRRVMLRMRWCWQCRCTGEKWLREKSRWSWWLWWTVWWGKMALRPRRNGFCSKQSKQVAAMPIPTTPTPTTWPMSSLWNWRTGMARWARALPSQRSNQSKRWCGCAEATQPRKHAQSVSTISKNIKNSRNCQTVRTNTTPNA